MPDVAVQKDSFYQFKLYFMSWFMPLLLVIGFCGTAMNLLIIVRYRVFQRTTSILFSALAIADLINLVFAATYLYVSVYWDLDPMKYGPAGCFAVPYLEAIGYWLSPWIQATISFHRMLAIRFPLRIRQWLTSTRTAALIGGLSALVVSYALVAPLCHRWSSSSRSSSNNSSSSGGNFSSETSGCRIKDGREFVVYYSHGLFGSIVPFFIMILCTCLIVYFVCRSRSSVVRTFRRMSVHQARLLQGTQLPNSAQSQLQPQARSISQDACSAGSSSRSRTAQQQQQQPVSHQKRSSGPTGSGGTEKRVTQMLILMNVTYFVTNGLAGLFLISKVHLSSGGESEFARVWTMLHRFFDACACLNNSTNWIFFLLSGRKFRNKFFSLLRCRTEELGGHQRTQTNTFQQQQQQQTNGEEQAAVNPHPFCCLERFYSRSRNLDEGSNRRNGCNNPRLATGLDQRAASATREIAIDFTTSV